MNIASIDIGTNTVLLLIANINKQNGKIKSLLNKYRMPRLGKGLLPGKPISEDRIAALFEVLDEYSDLIRQYECEKVIAKGTSALRIATNREEIIDAVKKRFGINIEVIHGSQEAKLSYLGAISEVESDRYLVIDIGGGSTEIIYGDKDSIEYSKSFEAGVVNLTEKFIKHDPPMPDELDLLNSQVREIFAELNGKFPNNFTAVAVAGTPTSLSCIKQDLSFYSEEKVEGSILTITDLAEMMDWFSTRTSKDILSLYPEILSGREDIILAGTIILRNILLLLRSDNVTVSARGIRYGAIFDYIIRESGSV